MSRSLFTAILAAIAFQAMPASASPICLKKHQSFALDADTVTLNMKLPPGSDCIQGLRRSYMQIYAMKVIEAPKRGTLTIVGSGYRYVADSVPGEDRFTIMVEGKNRNDLGSSIVQVIVNATDSADIATSAPIATSAQSASALPLLL